MPEPLITAALIVRDEAAFLDGCLTSIRELVDEIVVVDTGSRDASREIAAAHGATLGEFPWIDDFAAARNASLDLATGVWILYIDADEQLAPVDPDSVRDMLRRTDAVAFRLFLRPSSASTPYREYRLWRNDPRIRFDGIIHEKVVPAIHRVADEDGRPVLLCDLQLEHYGYEGDQTRKHLRNRPMLERQCAAEPENLFVWHHLFRVQTGLGDHELAESTLIKGIDVARSKPWIDPVGVLLYADLIRLRDSRGDDVAELLDEALQRYPDNLILRWHSGRIALKGHDHEAAIGHFQYILDSDPATLPDPAPAYDRRLFDELPSDAVGLCLFRLGRYDEAAEYFRAAAAYAPNNGAYAAKLALALARSASGGQPGRLAD